MTPHQRPYYKTKADWAAAKAQEIHQHARSLPTVPAGNWRGVRRRMAAMRTMQADAWRYERMAKRFREQGV